MNAYTCFVYVCECYQELSNWRDNACPFKIGFPMRRYLKRILR